MNNEFKYILVCGDIHRQFDVIPNFIRDHKLNNCAIIVAGDFGIGFQEEKREAKFINYLNNRLNHTNSTIFVVRGNHDNPKYFLDENYNTKYIKFVKDYTVLNLNNNNILCVGGAISVDRTSRAAYQFGKGSDWWKNEVINYDYDKLKELKNIDYVITHSSPHFSYPITKEGLYYWVDRDIHLLHEVEVERQLLTKIYEDLYIQGNKIKKWFYGHFHNSYKLPYNETDFICLNINEFMEIRN